jgi:hypothetical protein
VLRPWIVLEAAGVSENRDGHLVEVRGERSEGNGEPGTGNGERGQTFGSHGSPLTSYLLLLTSHFSPTSYRSPRLSIRCISSTSSRRAERALAISSNLRRYHRQESSTTPDERKMTSPISESMMRLVQSPATPTAAPSNASTAAAISVRVRPAKGDTPTTLADRPAATGQDDHSAIGNQTGV